MDDDSAKLERERRLRNPKARPQAQKGPQDDPEVKAEEQDVEARAETVMHQQEILEQLRAAKNAEARVRTFAKLADTYGLEAIIGLFVGLGDAATSAIAGVYLLYEAEKAGLSKWDYIKIVGLQTADFFVGAIPVVGDIADFFFKANKYALPLFQKRADELITEARAAGVSEEAIAKLTLSADKLPKVTDHAIAIHKIVKGEEIKEAA